MLFFSLYSFFNCWKAIMNTKTSLCRLPLLLAQALPITHKHLGAVPCPSRMRPGFEGKLQGCVATEPIACCMPHVNIASRDGHVSVPSPCVRVNVAFVYLPPLCSYLLPFSVHLSAPYLSLHPLSLRLSARSLFVSPPLSLSLYSLSVHLSIPSLFVPSPLSVHFSTPFLVLSPPSLLTSPLPICSSLYSLSVHFVPPPSWFISSFPVCSFLSPPPPTSLFVSPSLPVRFSTLSLFISQPLLCSSPSPPSLFPILFFDHCVSLSLSLTLVSLLVM